MSAIARTRNWLRWSWIVRSSPAAMLARKIDGRHQQQVEGQDLAEEGGSLSSRS